MTGAMMCEGGSRPSCRMYSPRSVSTTSMPAASSASLSAHSSLTIDFDLTALRTPLSRAIAVTIAFTSSVVSAQCTTVPRAVALRSNSSTKKSRWSSARLRIAAAASRVASKSTSVITAARPGTKRRLSPSSASRSAGSASFSLARRLKCIEATCIGVLLGAAGQHFGHVQHLRGGVAAPAQAAFDVEHAAEIAEHDRVCRRRRDAIAFHVDDAGRDVTELDRERAAEAAARFGLVHFAQRESVDLRQQFPRLALDAELTQTGARIVVGDRALEHPRNVAELRHAHEKIRQLVSLGGERLHAHLPFGRVGEELRIVRANHSGTRARRRIDVFARLELADQLLRELSRSGPVTRVVARLTAARLRLRDLHFAAGRLQQTQGGES